MAVAQGIKKQTVIFKQAALGTPGAGAGGQILRRITSVFQANRATFASNEIVSHQQSTGVGYGQKSIVGTLTCLLSPATYKLLFAAMMRKDFVVGVNTTAITTVTSAVTTGDDGTFTRSAGSYLTDGFKIGDIVRWTGWATTGTPNNNKNLMIYALTATVMTVTGFDNVALGAKAAGDTVTCTVVGKKTLAPLTGHTNDYFTVEEWFSDLSKSELFTDVKPAKITVGLPATGNATFACDLLGLLRTVGVAQVLTTPTTETTTPILTAVNGAVWINGAVFNCTGATLVIDGTTTPGQAEVGSVISSDIGRGNIAVSGTFTGLFKDTVIQALYEAQTVVGLVLVVLDNTSGLSSFKTYSMSAIKITGDAPDDGQKQIVRTYPFTAQINAAGGLALANDQTILSIQDSDA